MNGILSGLRIIEGSAFVAAPLAGMTLAQMGADVIRFDPVGGGLDYRRWPVTSDNRSLYWAGLNKGKRSIAIDIRRPEGRELATSLIAAPGEGGGIFLTNFPASGWLDYQKLRQRRQDLIMLAISGNRDGSSEVDYTVNCATGLPFLLGHEGGGRPVNNVLPAWDLVAGLTAVSGIIGAERQRRLTGSGQLIGLALSDVAFAAMGALGFIGEAIVNGTDRPATGNDLYGAFGRDFLSKDGRYVMIVAISQRQWEALVKATGLAEQFKLIEAAFGVDLADEGSRFKARKALDALIEQWCAARSYKDISEAFGAAGVLWGPYRTTREMVKDDPRCSTANPMFAEIDQPGIGRYIVPGSPLDFVGGGTPAPAPAPLLGQHTDEILTTVVGLSGAQIGVLYDKGVVAGP